jgi:hypothetical protein
MITIKVVSHKVCKRKVILKFFEPPQLKKNSEITFTMFKNAQYEKR